MLGLLYGCELRSYDLCNLLQSDIDFERKTVFLKKKKEKTDTVSKRVTFSLKNYRNHCKKTIQTLSAKDFIKRFQNHILAKGFTRIRHYGFLSSSWKKDKLPLLQLQLAEKDLLHIEPLLIQEKSLHRVCPSCKKGELITILTFDSRGPPKNHEKIIKRKLLKFKT